MTKVATCLQAAHANFSQKVCQLLDVKAVELPHQHTYQYQQTPPP